MRTDVDDWWEYGWVFHAMNTNKRSVTLDLQSDDGIRLVKELVSQADVVIENFSPRVMDHFGLGADALLELNPRLVVVRMPAFGLTGPWRDRVGFAPTMEQIAGLAWVTGLPDGPARPTARRLRPARGRACGVRVAGGAGVRRPHRPRPARRGADDRDRAQRDRRADNGIRGFRVDHGAAGQPRALGRDAGRLPVRGRRQLDRGERMRTDDERDALGRELIGDRECRRSSEWFAAQEATSSSTALPSAGIPAAVVVSPSLVTENPQLVHRGFFERLDASEHRRRPVPVSAVRPARRRRTAGCAARRRRWASTTARC